MWIIPILYALCAVCFFVHLSESYRRVRLAEDIALILREEKPADLEELQTLLGKHVDRVIRMEGTEAWPERYGARISLKPDVLLSVRVHLDPETDAIVETHLMYISNKVPLDNPRAFLHSPPFWRNVLFYLAIAVFPAWLWLSICRRSPKGILDVVVLMAVGFSLPFVLVRAGFCLERIWI